MGVKATLAGITLTGGDLTQAESLGLDVKGLMTTAQMKCDDLKSLLNLIASDVLTPAGDTTNAATLAAQVTALS
jgi:hypothetical protein